jgi:hypothetical protein
MKKLILILLIALIFLPNLVLAQWSDWFNINYVWEEVFGLPSEWTQPRNLIFNFIVPFIAIFAVCLGLLRALRIFQRTPNIEIVLAFAMAFMTLPSKAFVLFVSFTLGLAGVYSYGIFLALIFVGGYYYFLIKRRTWGTEAGTAFAYKQATRNLREKIKDISVRREEIMMELGKTSPPPPPERIASLQDELRRLDEMEQQILAQLKTIKRET